MATIVYLAVFFAAHPIAAASSSATKDQVQTQLHESLRLRVGAKLTESSQTLEYLGASKGYDPHSPPDLGTMKPTPSPSPRPTRSPAKSPSMAPSLALPAECLDSPCGWECPRKGGATKWVCAYDAKHSSVYLNKLDCKYVGPCTKSPTTPTMAPTPNDCSCSDSTAATAASCTLKVYDNEVDHYTCSDFESYGAEFCPAAGDGTSARCGVKTSAGDDDPIFEGCEPCSSGSAPTSSAPTDCTGKCVGNCEISGGGTTKGVCKWAEAVPPKPTGCNPNVEPTYYPVKNNGCTFKGLDAACRCTYNGPINIGGD